MKRIFTFFTVTLLLGSSAFAQWCTPTATPTTMNAYSSSAPVITNVTLNTINRTSLASSHELYIYTQVGTSLAQSSSHAFSMTWTKDIPVCPEQNIRVWIDWNQDGDFTDSGELAYTLSNSTFAATSGTINVPATATLGLTRMRVAMKMVPNCGHTLPDPCVPPESVGWHGEIEDYDITITAPTGINEVIKTKNLNLFTNKEGLQVEYFLLENSNVQLNIYNVYGQKVNSFSAEQQNVGEQKMIVSNSAFTSAGIYFATLTVDGKSYTEKIVITK